MAAEDEEEKVEGKEPKKEKSKSNIVPLILIIVVVLLIQGGIAFVIVKVTAPKADVVDTTAQDSTTDTTGSSVASTAPANEVVEGKVHTFIVNIAGTDAERYLKLSLQVAYDGDAAKKNKTFLTTLASNEVPAKNYINQYLSSLTLEEVSDKNAQQNIRGDLVRGVNRLFPEGVELSNIYITEFLIQ